MSTVSYANVAANGSNGSSTAVSNGSTTVNSPKSDDVKPIVSVDASSVDAVTDAPANDAGKAESKESKDDKVTKPKEKKLAPAPVPKTNAWGNASSNPSDSNVDEYKWPTPDQQTEKSQSNKPQKFIKPVTTKWVPINAKVILPNSRSQNQSGNKKNNKKNNNKNSKNKKVNGTSNNLNKPKKSDKLEKKDDKKDEEKLVSDVKNLSIDNENGNPTISGSDNDNSNSLDETVTNTDANQESQSPKSNDSKSQNGAVNGTSQSHPSQQTQYQNQQQYNNNRQYNKVNYRSNRFSVPNGGAQYGNYIPFNPYQHHQSLPNNFYGYPPQQGMVPFMANQPPPVPGNYPPYPQQFAIPTIPPPIVPKQDPVSALTQQIDYYFSFENLIKDVFLRKSFDKESGFVNINVILSFKRVQQILNQIKSLNLTQEYDEIIKDAVRNCSNIEINDNEDLNKVEIRVKNDYKKFILD